MGDDLFPAILAALKLAKRKDFLAELRTNRNHDERAALICLLTAAGVAAGKYTAIGDAKGGYFFLPPWRHWQAWAKQTVVCGRVRRGDIDVWIDGQRFGGSMPIKKK